VFHTLVSSVSSVFFCMLQLLYLDVSRVLHMGCVWKTSRAAWVTSGAAQDHYFCAYSRARRARCSR
jgi:hypothetical protein